MNRGPGGECGAVVRGELCDLRTPGLGSPVTFTRWRFKSHLWISVGTEVKIRQRIMWLTKCHVGGTTYFFWVLSFSVRNPRPYLSPGHQQLKDEDPVHLPRRFTSAWTSRNEKRTSGKKGGPDPERSILPDESRSRLSLLWLVKPLVDDSCFRFLLFFIVLQYSLRSTSTPLPCRHVVAVSLHTPVVRPPGVLLGSRVRRERSRLRLGVSLRRWYLPTPRVSHSTRFVLEDYMR